MSLVETGYRIDKNSKQNKNEYQPYKDYDSRADTATRAFLTANYQQPIIVIVLFNGMDHTTAISRWHCGPGHRGPALGQHEPSCRHSSGPSDPQRQLGPKRLYQQALAAAWDAGP
jgi:hypothetical protein